MNEESKGRVSISKCGASGVKLSEGNFRRAESGDGLHQSRDD